MKKPKRVAIILGTRPEVVKLAPVIQEMDSSADIEPITIVTGQHREMLDPLMAFFGITPQHDLNILRPSQSLTDIVVRSLTGLTEILKNEKPDMVVVQGDTTTTFAGALAAFYCGIRVAHVEAGMRTHNRFLPYPEEANRSLTARLTDLHLAATSSASHHLRLENIPAEEIVVTGNTVIDALLWAVDQQADYPDPALARIDTDSRQVLLVTAHRRESWGTGLRSIANALAILARRYPDILIVFPIHRNPIVREAILPAIGDEPNVLVVEPLDYGAFARLMRRSHLLLTDSGGIQEEGPSLGKPVLVMRDVTERPEGITAGTARLVGTASGDIVEAVAQLLDDKAAYAAMSQIRNPYGDGMARLRCVDAIKAFLDSKPRLMPEFSPQAAAQ